LIFAFFIYFKTKQLLLELAC